MGRIVKVITVIAVGFGLLFFVTCNNNLTTALLDKIEKERSEIPIPGGEGVLTTSVGMEYITVSWEKGSDNKTSESDLEYLVVYSESDNISTLTTAEDNGTASGEWTKDVATLDATGLLDNITYWVNVIVRDGSGNKAVYEMELDTTVKKSLLFWADGLLDMIQRIDLYDDPVVVENIVTGVNAPWGVDIDPVDRKIYWTETNITFRIQRSNFDGSEVETLIDTNLSYPTGLAVDHENRLLFWTDYTENAVYKASLPISDSDASSHIFMDTGESVSQPYGIDVDMLNGVVYWIEDRATDVVRECSINAKGIGDITDHTDPNLLAPIDLVVYPTGITATSLVYFVDFIGVSPPSPPDQYHIYTFDYAFTTDTMLVNTDMTNPIGIDLDVNTSKMYWTDSSDRTISAANRDGTSQEQLVTVGLSYPTGIAVY